MMSQVIIYDHVYRIHTNAYTATTKQWSMREWLHNFLDEGQTYIVDENEYDDDQLPGTSSTAPGIEEEYIDDGLIESLIIVVLAGILVWLVYLRQAQQLAHRRAEAAAQARQGVQDVGNAQQPEGGFFPPPGDPALPEWLAGGIGH
jgi:SEL1 protein